MNRILRASLTALRAVPFAAAAVTIAAVGVDPAGADPGDKAFTKLAVAFADHYLAYRPHEAIRLGLKEKDRATVVLSDASIEAERAWLVTFSHEYALFTNKYPPRKLNPSLRIDRRILEARLDRLSLNFEVLKRQESDPNAYLPLIEEPVRVLLARRPGNPCSRERDITRQLTAVPEVLRAAQATLRHPSRIATESAIANYTRALELYRKSLPRAVRECRDATATADLAVADTLAARAVEGFVDWLRADLLPISDSTLSIGAETYARLLRDDTMRDEPFEAIEGTVAAALARSRARRDSIEVLVGPSGESPARSDSALQNFATRTLESTRAFLRKKKLVTLPERDRVRWQPTPPGAEPRGGIGVVPDEAWLWPGKKIKLDLRVSAASAAGADRADVMLDVLRDVLPGRALFVLSRTTKVSHLRNAFASPATADGWADYAVRVLLDAGYAKDDPALALAAENRALETLARLSAEIAIHAHGASIQDAARTLEQKAGLDSTRAMGLALLAGATPGGASSALERIGLLELRDRAKDRGRRRYRDQRLHDAILAEGPVPVGGIEERVISRQKRRWLWWLFGAS